MTEKRFTHKKWYNDRQLFDGDEAFAIVDVYIQAEAICNKLNELHEENKELKERNNRQCRQLDKLYKLIEKEDWNSLTKIIQELKEADEKLQEEWGAYGDFE